VCPASGISPATSTVKARAVTMPTTPRVRGAVSKPYKRPPRWIESSPGVVTPRRAARRAGRHPWRRLLEAGAGALDVRPPSRVVGMAVRLVRVGLPEQRDRLIVVQPRHRKVIAVAEGFLAFLLHARLNVGDAGGAADRGVDRVGAFERGNRVGQVAGLHQIVG